MTDYIPISTLNDFIFCPYSIYLHNVYMETDEGLYHATPQTKGKLAHEPVDSKTSSNMYAKQFGGDDSVVVFDIGNTKVGKFWNAAHRDQDIVYF